MANNHTAGAAARTFAPSELCQRMLAKTSKGTCGPCILYLEDGTIFYGRACGAEGTATGEVCFNTSLEGYFEVMTDPSYAGQIVTMTYPQIGNYGIDETDVQSAFPGAVSYTHLDVYQRQARHRPRHLSVRDVFQLHRRRRHHRLWRGHEAVS